jgi:hypothetical protein
MNLSGSLPLICFTFQVGIMILFVELFFKIFILANCAQQTHGLDIVPGKVKWLKTTSGAFGE